ncbi:DEAD/DEAH box helicase [Bartonella taylorii]|uniref:DEAD/DEAH box helicase family protein n=1 Tax=Bartonella taylorii TaxID=33046 RepID=A0A9Q9DM78_BARTA|nr:type ISP restriction/modification enzyme [Bartonella taylorii]USP02892.1 DEAD/DEAH box helicase family protein [Bartonella taylorii]
MLQSHNKPLTLRSLLQSYRDHTEGARDRGTSFEKFVIAYLTQDPLQCQEYEKVQTYRDWAREHGWDGTDIGIDLVAKIRDEEGYAAIQCKFYSANHQIKKEDIDSFIAASGKAPFTRRILIDSTEGNWSNNADLTCEGQEVRIQRINLFDLENSQIDWSTFESKGEATLKKKEPKKLLDHQQEALKAVCEGLQEADRGKLIMACGTGKTFTSLKIAEALAGQGKRVLFLVPSLSLMSQTIREWTADTDIPLRSFAVCSDAQVGKRRKAQDDAAELDVSDLALPATTDAQKLGEKANKTSPDAMTVVFATYHSIQVISDAQKKYALPEFDLIICDEAHRTTGAVLGTDKSESEFIKVHDNSLIRGKKRLYMTATPRIFSDNAKKQANEIDAVLASMDDEELYGKILYSYSFSHAVKNGLLTPYKIIVLGVDEGEVSKSIQHLMTDENYELILDDRTKIVGCYQALTKMDLKIDLGDDTRPMHRALAFCRDIDTSERICRTFNDEEVKKDLLDLHENHKNIPPLNCQADHINGKSGAKDRTIKLDWLKEDAGENICRILTNVRCLSEGVDVPSLDAVMFLHPRKSQVDVIQAVGRVMRRAKGKKMGYIILPVGVPAGVSPEEALKNNKRYSVVWQVLNALLAHDENFSKTLNQMVLGQDVSSIIDIVTVSKKTELENVTTVIDEIPLHEKSEKSGLQIGTQAHEPQHSHSVTGRLPFFVEFPNALKTLIVKKSTMSDYWGIWANNVAEIAQNHITRLQTMLSDQTSEAYHAFDAFYKELKNNLNSEIKQEEAIEMLAQHLVTRPVFEALFEGNEFVQNNAISQAMEKILRELDKTNIEEESKELQEFYDSVKFRASGITEPQARQNLIIKLYEDFFAKAFKKTTDRLGIVYTPVEVVDFIIHSVDDVLRNEFGKSLGSRGVSILDPFTGTGTFITRLLQSNLIKPEDMEYKFRHDIHANEIVLLAYYIAAINIESTYHSLKKGEYIPFKHIGLADTFRMVEKQDLMKGLLEENSAYLEHQKNLNIEVIFGNPPYSSGQRSANDNNANVEYEILDRSIQNTYALKSQATLKKNLYDSYIRAIRWASNRLSFQGGIVAYISGNGWIDKAFADGMRKCLQNEYSSIYIINLRGDIRKNIKSKELSKEGGNVFGSGSQNGIAVTIFVRNPNKQKPCKIYYHDIGDNLSTEKKLEMLQYVGSVGGITNKSGWKIITPDEHGDWIHQRDNNFKTFLAIGDKKGCNFRLFETFSLGVVTNRDAWTYNSSRETLKKNMSNMIAFYNSEVERFNDTYGHVDRRIRTKAVNDFVDTDERKISWSYNVKQELVRGKIFELKDRCLIQSLYRPFTKQWLYYNRTFNERVLQMPRIFPMGKVVENMVIQITGTGTQSGFSVLMAKNLPNLHAIDTGQCFPRYFYEDIASLKSKDNNQSHLFTNATEENKTSALQRRDAITDEGLAHFKAAYPNEIITKDDLFYYVYGLLHSEDYRAHYADNLSKELPRIPCVKTADDFWSFVNAGRELGNLHVNYEDVEPYPVTFKKGNPKQADIPNPEKFYYVTEMKFAKAGKEKDKSTVIYNSNIIMTDIPLEAYDYIVNGRPALEWVMGRQCVKTDKKSGIVNDANRYAVETIGNPAYPLELFQRVITVSLETMKIVKNLPKLEMRETE